MAKKRKVESNESLVDKLRDLCHEHAKAENETTKEVALAKIRECCGEILQKDKPRE
jgi:hypothetical protein